MQTHITHSTPELPLLQGASQVLQDYFAKDSQAIPDIGELLVLRRSVQPRARWLILNPPCQPVHLHQPLTPFLPMTIEFRFKKGD
jgi:hypothetical protein